MNKPIATKGSFCPLWRKGVEKVCHTCEWFTQVRGSNPQTGEEIDKWCCAIAMLPMLTIENSKEVRQSAAATESFRNEVTKIGTVMVMQARAARVGHTGEKHETLDHRP